MSKSPIFLTTAQQQAHAYLRDRIIFGEFPGGMRLKSEELANRLKISRMPIREALLQLHAEGLVEIKRNHGASVVKLSPSDIMEIFLIRSALEGLACRLALPRIKKKHVKVLDELLSKMQVHQKADGWIASHDRFHDHLCGIAAMPRLSQQIRQLHNQTRPYIRLYVTSHINNPDPPGLEHRALLNKILDSTPNHAENAMCNHIVENAKSIVEFLESIQSKKDDGSEASRTSSKSSHLKIGGGSALEA